MEACQRLSAFHQISRAPRQATDGSDGSDAEHRVPRTVGVSKPFASWSAATDPCGGAHPRRKTSNVLCFIRSIRPIRGSARSRPLSLWLQSLHAPPLRSSASSAACLVGRKGGREKGRKGRKGVRPARSKKHWGAVGCGLSAMSATMTPTRWRSRAATPEPGPQGAASSVWRVSFGRAPRRATDGSDGSDAEHRVPRTVGVFDRSASWSAATDPSGECSIRIPERTQAASGGRILSAWGATTLQGRDEKTRHVAVKRFAARTASTLTTLKGRGTRAAERPEIF